MGFVVINWTWELTDSDDSLVLLRCCTPYRRIMGTIRRYCDVLESRRGVRSLASRSSKSLFQYKIGTPLTSPQYTVPECYSAMYIPSTSTQVFRIMVRFERTDDSYNDDVNRLVPIPLVFTLNLISQNLFCLLANPIGSALGQLIAPLLPGPRESVCKSTLSPILVPKKPTTDSTGPCPWCYLDCSHSTGCVDWFSSTYSTMYVSVD